MLSYLIRRLLILIPTLIVISVIVFFISIQAPGDPAIILLSKNSATGDRNQGIERELLLEKRSEMGLDRKIFYFDFSSRASYENLQKIPFQAEREMLKKLSIKTGRPDLVKQYYNKLLHAQDNETIHQLLREDNLNNIPDLLGELPPNPDSKKIRSSFERLQNEQKPINNYVPKIEWNTLDNQYHNWLMKFISGDFGKSYSDGVKVSVKIWEGLKVTLSMTILALLLSLLLSIILAIMAAYSASSFLPRILEFLFFSLYSTPTFIVATIAVILIGSPEYLDLLPVYGMGNYHPSMGNWERIAELASHLILPIFCLAYLPTAFFYQQLYGKLQENMQMDYAIVARAKGLGKFRIITSHALRNSVLPMISHLANIFPAIIGGSFVVEFIFSLPGMGMLTIDSVFARDYPVVFAALFLISFAALIGAVLSDFLLMLVDPRISLDN